MLVAEAAEEGSVVAQLENFLDVDELEGALAYVVARIQRVINLRALGRGVHHVVG